MKIDLRNDRLNRETKLLAKTLKQSEEKLVTRLILVEERNAYRDLNLKGLFTYCVKHLEMNEPAAQMYRNLVNRALEMPALRKALESDDPGTKLTPAYAIRIVSSLTPDNVEEVLDYARKNSIRETRRWLIREKGVVRDAKMNVDTEVLELVRELKGLLPGNLSDLPTLKRALVECRDKYDPIKKAERAQKQKSRSANAEHTTGRRRLAAREKHDLALRDRNRCTFLGEGGHRCRNQRWLHTHHIHEVAYGGGNELSNIITLCAEHHDLVHQMCFPIDLQRSWIPTGASPDLH